MKKLKYFTNVTMIICIVMVFTNCKETTATQTEVVEETLIEEVAEISHSDFKGIWEQVDALWERRDPELIPTVYADEFTRVSPSGTSTNVEELTNEFNLINGAYPDMQLNLDDYIINDNVVVVNWSVDGTFSGELLGIKGNGKPFQDLKGITVFTFKEGKVVKDDSSWNALELFLQTGYEVVEKQK